MIMPSNESENFEILFSRLARPAQRALTNAGIRTVEELASYSENEVAGFHGIGKNALATIKEVLHISGLNFNEE